MRRELLEKHSNIIDSSVTRNDIQIIITIDFEVDWH